MRIKFSSKKGHLNFFNESFLKGNFKTWKEFCRNFKLNRKTLAGYRSGKTTLPEEVYKRICLYSKVQGNNLIFIEDNWGRIKGGKSAYKKNKKSFDFGRKKAIERIKLNAQKIDINLPLTSNLAYLIGLFIGDGFTNKYGRSYFIQFTGHVSEKEFYENFVSKIVKKELGLIPRLKKDNYCNAIRFNIHCKDLFLLITKRFKIAAGRKSSFVLIPKEIEKSPFVLGCLAGIFDAEGCFYLDCRTIYKKGYPRLDLHMNNPLLIKQISEVLYSHKISHSVSKNYGNILIYGEGNIKGFLKKIKIRNPKILNKIKF